MISCHNKILTSVGYRYLSSVTADTPLLDGKIYEIYFDTLQKENLVSICFIDYNSTEVPLLLNDQHRLLSPDGDSNMGNSNMGGNGTATANLKKVKRELKPSKIVRGDRFLYYNKKQNKIEIKTVTGVSVPKKFKTIYCAFPITTSEIYIMNGVYIKNAGF